MTLINMYKRYFSLAFLFFLLAPAGQGYTDTLRIGIVSPMQRVFDSTQTGPTYGRIELWAARNEFESTQIVLNSNTEVTVDRIEASDLKHSATGAIILSKYFTYGLPTSVYLEKHTDNTPSNELDGNVPGWFPDPIVKFKPISFRGNCSILLNLYVPPNAMQGIYSGNLSIHYGRNVHSLPLILHVWNFTLPKIPSLFVTNWIHTSQLEAHYKITRTDDKYWILLANIAKDMSAHRQSVIFTPLNLIQSTKSSDGEYSFDFTDYKRWVNIFSSHGFQVYEGSHLFHARNSYDLTEIRKPYTRKRVEVGESFLNTPQGREYLKQLLSALHQENSKLGIHTKYIQHIADEPKPTQMALYRTIANVVRGAMPGVAIVDAIDVNSLEYSGVIDIPVTRMDHPTAPVNDSRWGRWWYTAVAPRGRYPNRFIDYPLLKMRVIPWLSWRSGISGYLHYAYNWWFTPSGESPWKNASQSGKYPPGDGFVVYPPTEGGGIDVIPSLRWESFRDGMEDYEYLVLLEKWKATISETKERSATVKSDYSAQLGKIDSVLGEIKSKFGAPERYPRRANEIEALRIKMGTLLDELSSNLN